MTSPIRTARGSVAVVNAYVVPVAGPPVAGGTVLVEGPAGAVPVVPAEAVGVEQAAGEPVGETLRHAELPAVLLEVGLDGRGRVVRLIPVVDEFGLVFGAGDQERDVGHAALPRCWVVRRNGVWVPMNSGRIVDFSHAVYRQRSLSLCLSHHFTGWCLWQRTAARSTR